MASGFIYRFAHPVGYDGPVSFDKITHVLKDVSAGVPDDKVLIIYNTSQRRFLLPVAYAFKKEVSYFIPGDDEPENELTGVNLNDYQLVCLVNTIIPARKTQKLKWRNFDAKKAGDMLSSAGFSFIRSDGPFDQINTTRIISYRSN
jgi:hypothetical protein